MKKKIMTDFIYAVIGFFLGIIVFYFYQMYVEDKNKEIHLTDKELQEYSSLEKQNSFNNLNIK